MIERAMKVANLLEQIMILDGEMTTIHEMSENEGKIAMEAVLKKIRELKNMLYI